MKKSLRFALLSALLLLFPLSGCDREAEARDRQQAYEDAYEEGYKAGQEDILEDPGAYGVGSYVEYDDSSDEEAAYERGFDDGYGEGYQDCLDEHGITDEEWDSLHED